MHFSSHYAILFILAGFAAGAYFLRVGPKAKQVPIYGLALCTLFTMADYGFMYAMLTVIEYAIGFGVAHALVKPDKQDSDSTNEHDKT